MTKPLLDELMRRLRQDFLAANLGPAATLAHEASWNNPSPLGLFVVTTVLRHLEGHWDVPTLRNQAWMTQEALADMESRMRPPLLDYLAKASNASSLDCTEEMALLNAIVQPLFRWTAEGQIHDQHPPEPMSQMSR